MKVVISVIVVIAILIFGTIHIAMKTPISGIQCKYIESYCERYPEIVPTVLSALSNDGKIDRYEYSDIERRVELAQSNKLKKKLGFK